MLYQVGMYHALQLLHRFTKIFNRCPQLDNRFIRVALTEEVFKLLPVLWLALRTDVIDEPMDGVVYAVSAALGFAAAENAVYALQAGNLLAIVRGFTSTLMHVTLSGLVGYAIGMACHGRRYRTIIAFAAFAAAVALHGAYNFFIALGALPEMPEWIARGTVALLIPAMLILFTMAMRRADRLSPHRRAVVAAKRAAAEVVTQEA